MNIEIADGDLKSGVLGLVVALVEIVKEALRLQALKRMENGALSEQEVERLGSALMDLDTVIDRIKTEMGIAASVKAVRDGLDKIVDQAIDDILNPRPLEKVGPMQHHDSK
ncbi:MAG: gas vesicle protein K [Chloroflexi bacterium]|nr:gas vesicle protein K [Chloroflexota bacterium]